MRSLLSLVVLCLAASIGDAEPTAYIQSGAESGAGTYTGSYVGIGLDGGYRLYGWLWLHGHLGYGGRGTVYLDRLSFDLFRDYQEARVGLEARTCTRGGHACLVSGVDGGVHHMDNDPGMRDGYTTGVAIGRLYGDFGTANLRVRPAFEVGFGNAMSDDPTPAALLYWNRVSVSLAVAYQW
jgi:hypothetical protein